MSLHSDALAVLEGWAAPTPAQAALREAYVAHLRARPDGMERACFPDHLTAGAVVLSADGGSVLLNLHRKARRWFHFGGHCEADDATLAGAALRETLEESGLAAVDFDPVPVQLSDHAVEFCDPRGTVRHLDVRFLAVAPPGVEHAASEESLEVRWFALDDLPDLEDEMHELIALARRRAAQSSASRSSVAADQPSR